MSLYSSLNIARQALQLSQSAMTVVSNNIANIDTAGYSKQRVDQVTNGEIVIQGNSGIYQVSAGAQIGSITRYRNAAIDATYRNENADVNYYNEMYTMASQIETAVNGLSDSSLSNALSDFFTSADTLSSNPADSTARTNFVQKAQVLCTQFNSISKTINTERTSVVGNINDDASLNTCATSNAISELNTKLQQLGDINTNIIKATKDGTTPNDLLDQRDKLLDDISAYIPVTTTTNDNGSVSLYMNGQALVKGVVVNELRAVQSTDDNNPITIKLEDPDGNPITDNINSSFTTGSISAYLKMGGNISGELSYKGILTKLDNLASGVATAINSIQTYTSPTTKALGIAYDAATGNKVLSDYAGVVNSDGTMGLPTIFSPSGGAGPILASNISVNSDIQSNYWKIAAARADTTALDYNASAVGNNDNAELFSAVKKDSGIATIGNMTPSNYLSSFVTELGSKVETLKFNKESATSIFNSTTTDRKNTSGVSIDEELVDLMKYQRSYEAAAKLFSVTTQMLQLLMNLGQ